MKKTLKAGNIDFTKKYVCMECGCQRDPIDVKRGLLAIEIFMWLLYIFPGVIYSIWRRVRKHQVCPNCRNPSIVLMSSSRAMEMRRLMKAFPQPPQANSKNSIPNSSQKPAPRDQIQSQKPTSGKKDLDQILKSANRRGLKPKGQQGLIDFKSPDQSQ
jgi:hypothetical protein